MLKVDLRELAKGPVDTQAEVAANDPLFEGTGAPLAGPVAVGGRLQATGEGRFYWHGTLRAAVAEECRRCLIPVTVTVTADVGALFTGDADALQDPDAYPLPPHATEVDLRPAVREELLLALPRFVVCREDCRGLCPRCGKDLNAGPCGCAPEPDPRWKALADLKGKLRD
ncbi:MAG: YceD family protein [Gemmatimonadales bacterium]